MKLINRPLKAEDLVEDKIDFQKYGWMVQPKIDGVRAMHLHGQFTGRTLKPFANAHTQATYNRHEYVGFDGELAAESETHPRLCSLTSSAVNTSRGNTTPFTLWWLFDYLGNRGQYAKMPYEERFYALRARVLELRSPFLRCVPGHVVKSLSQLLEHEEHWLGLGYEGLILRRLDGPYKQGRSTVREGYLLRLKRFVQEQFVIEELYEAMENTNEATINELGYTERSSHQEGKVPKGMLGGFRGTCCKTGKAITVGAGEMDHDERRRAWENPDLYIKKKGIYKHFPKGVKDKPRFPTWVCLVGESDLE